MRTTEKAKLLVAILEAALRLHLRCYNRQQVSGICRDCERDLGVIDQTVWRLINELSSTDGEVEILRRLVFGRDEP